MLGNLLGKILAVPVRILNLPVKVISTLDYLWLNRAGYYSLRFRGAGRLDAFTLLWRAGWRWAKILGGEKK